MTSSTKTAQTHHSSSGIWSQKTTSNIQYHQENSSNFSTSRGGLLSSNESLSLPSSASLEPMSQSQREKEDLEAAKASLKEREIRLDEREAEVEKREKALDAAHERLIGAQEEEEEAEEDEDEAQPKKPSPKTPSPSDNSSTIIETLRQENSNLRAELAASNKRSGRFLSQRAQQEDMSGHDRFKLSERKPKNPDGKSAGGLRSPMGFDPALMARWKSGHAMMSPRKPRPAGSRPDGE